LQFVILSDDHINNIYGGFVWINPIKNALQHLKNQL
jgi:hypothetical protein